MKRYQRTRRSLLALGRGGMRVSALDVGTGRTAEAGADRRQRFRR